MFIDNEIIGIKLVDCTAIPSALRTKEYFGTAGQILRVLHNEGSRAMDPEILPAAEDYFTRGGAGIACILRGRAERMLQTTEVMGAVMVSIDDYHGTYMNGSRRLSLCSPAVRCKVYYLYCEDGSYKRCIRAYFEKLDIIGPHNQPEPRACYGYPGLVTYDPEGWVYNQLMFTDTT